MKLLHKGLILISVPLAFELFFAIGFGSLLKKQLEQLNRETRAKQVIAKAERVHVLLSESTILVGIHGKNRSANVDARFDTVWKKIREDYQALKALETNDPVGTRIMEAADRQLKKVERLQRLIIDGTLDANQQVAPVLDAAISAHVIQWYQNREERRKTAPLQILIQKELQSVKQQNTPQTEFSTQPAKFLLFGICADALLLVSLAVFFGRNIEQRLSNLMNTTRLMSKGQDLLPPPLKGDDELAQCEILLHDAAARIIEIQRFKKQLLGVVCHELKAPLSAVHVLLSLIETESALLTEKAIRAVDEAERHCIHLQKMVVELLNQEALRANSGEGSNGTVQAGATVADSSRKKRGFRVRDKGLILIGLPFATQLVVTGALAMLLQQAESQVEQQAESRKVTTDAQRVIEAAGDSAILSLVGRGEQDITGLYEGQQKLMTEALAKLEATCATDPARLAASRSISKVLAEINQLQTRLIKDTLIYGEAMREGRPEERQRYAALWTDLSKQTDLLAVREEERESFSNKSLDAIVGNLDRVIMLGLALNILCAVGLASFLTRNITNRISKVQLNAQRLLTKESLLPQVSGGDEIAELDQAFHAAARILGEEQQLKLQLLTVAREELRSPLTSIYTTLTSLSAEEMGKLPDTVARRVAKAAGATERLIALINDILDIEKLEAGKFVLAVEPVSARLLSARSVACIRPLADKKNILIENAVGNELVLADSERLTQVLVNLLSNAIKFSNENQAIRIDSARDREPGNLVVSVRDQGSGIAADQRNRVFERFHSSNESGKNAKGTGLGLPISKAIIEQHGGKVGFESEEGKGATFWFTLPCATQLNTTEDVLGV